MIITVCAVIIGLLIFLTGIYYLLKSKDDAESKMIYGITSIIGFVIMLIATIILFVKYI